MDQQDIPFEPGENDVVATKNRTWNMKHIGNIAYHELLDCYLPKLQAEDEPTIRDYRQMAMEIINTIIHERKGRFLKLHGDELEQSVCRVMESKACIHKVVHALKERYRKFKAGVEARKRKRSNVVETSTVTGTGTTTKTTTKTTAKSVKPTRNFSSLDQEPLMSVVKNNVRISERKRRSQRPLRLSQSPPPPPTEGAVPASPVIGGEGHADPASFATPLTEVPKAKTFQYEARASDNQPIHPYALELISAICNQAKSTRHSYRILDQPLSTKYAIDDEPDKERQMRLQLRHRYVAAQAMNMSPLDFSRKILELWGGYLEQVEEETISTTPVTPVAPTAVEIDNSPTAVAESTVEVQPLSVQEVQEPNQPSPDMVQNDTTGVGEDASDVRSSNEDAQLLLEISNMGYGEAYVTTALGT